LERFAIGLIAYKFRLPGLSTATAMTMRPEMKAWLAGSLPTWMIAVGLTLGIVMEFRHGIFCRREAREMQAQLVHVMRMQAVARSGPQLIYSPPPLPQNGAAGGNWQDELKSLRQELRSNGTLK
jgi:hypothetical protein